MDRNQVTPLPQENIKTFSVSGTMNSGEKQNVTAMKDLLTHEYLAEHYRVFRPTFLSMKIFGLYFDCMDRNTKKNKVSFSQVYCGLVTFLVGVNACRLFAMFDKSDGFSAITFNKILVILWTMLCFGEAISCFRASYSYNCIAEFFEEWGKLHVHEGYFDIKTAKKQVLQLIIAGWMMIAMNMGFSIYGIFATNHFDWLYAPLRLSNPTHVLIAKIISILVQLILTCTWMLPVSFGCTICRMLEHEFSRFNARFAKQTISGYSEGMFEKSRQHHQAICRLVDHADDILSFHHAISYVINMVYSCVILYTMVTHSDAKSDPVLLVMNIFLFLSNMAVMGFISMSGGLINHQAHAALDTIHNIDTSTISSKEMLQVNMFLHKLNGPSIGLTALDMFVIDRPTILTLVGMLITYFIMLVQFNPSSNTASENMNACNATSLLT